MEHVDLELLFKSGYALLLNCFPLIFAIAGLYSIYQYTKTHAKLYIYLSTIYIVLMLMTGIIAFKITG